MASSTEGTRTAGPEQRLAGAVVRELVHAARERAPHRHRPLGASSGPERSAQMTDEEAPGTPGTTEYETGPSEEEPVVPTEEQGGADVP